MVKLVALFKTPKAPEEFETFFRDTVAPALRSLPGVQRLETTRITGAPFGESKYHLMAELFFLDRNGMEGALSSTEGKALARSLLRLAPDVAALFHGETEG
jgi:uncharacterized protein (TIGR02118 family)